MLISVIYPSYSWSYRTQSGPVLNGDVSNEVRKSFTNLRKP